MTYETIQFENTGGVARITLNRPEVRNAFNEQMIGEITQAFESIGADKSVRVVVLGGAGKAFCAGGDLNWMRKMAGYTHEENRADAAQLARMLKVIDDCPAPVIARIQGDCYAGGMGLAATSDIVICSDTSHFCLSEVKLGLIPATISPYVVNAMGAHAARRYFLTAERFNAQEALRIGFVHQTAVAEALEAVVDELVRALLANSPNAVREAKTLLKSVAGRELNDELIAYTVEGIAAIRASDEGREGVAAFLEKRTASWNLPQDSNT